MLALGIIPPPQKDYIYDSKPYVINFGALNSGSPLPIQIQFDGGILSENIKLSVEKATLQKNERLWFTLTITPPTNLLPGHYPITVKITDQTKQKGSMVANIRVEHTINLIKLYEKGFPFLELDAPNNAEANKQMQVKIFIKNIGISILKDETAELILKKNEEILTQTKIKLPELSSLEDSQIIEKIETYSPGIYLLQLKSQKQEFIKEIQIGKPMLIIGSIQQLEANRKNSFELPVELNWNKPIIPTFAEFVVSKNGQVLSFEAQDIKIIQSGQNIYILNIQLPNMMSDVYEGTLTINAPPYNFKNDFKIEIKGSKYSPLTTGVPILAKTNQTKLLAITLLLIMTIFFFSISRLLKKKNETT